MIRSLLLLIVALFITINIPSARAGVEVVAGAPATETISEPFSVAFDSKGVLHGVEFTKSNRVFRVVNGNVEFIAGVPYNAEKTKGAASDVHDGADPLKAVFNGMHDLQITRDDRAIIGDSFNHRVRLLNLKTGQVSTLAGTGETAFAGDGGPATAASFNVTMTATLSPDENRIYIADIGHHRTRMIDLKTGVITTVAGNGQKGLPVDGAAALETPMGDTRAVTQAADGTLYVLLRGGNSLAAVKDGKVRTVVNATGKKGYSGDGGPGREATLNGPKYVTMDPAGNVLIADAENHCIRRYNPKTEIIELIAGTPPKGGDKVGDTLKATELRRPHGVRIAPDGLIYIADTYNHRVLKAEYK